jgi:starch synthase
MAMGKSVLFLTSEMAPLVKLGGLGDVAGSLPLELRRLGWDARITLPLYPSLRTQLPSLTPITQLEIPTREGPLLAEIYPYEFQGLPVYLVDGPPIRTSDAVYHADAGQDAVKFIFFSLASLLFGKEIGWRPDVIHSNDWITAAANHWLALHGGTEPFFNGIRSLLSIHNLPFFGHNSAHALWLFDLDRLDPRRPERYDGFPEWAQSLLLPLGLAAADKIVAVSPAYAEEILTPQFGCGLETYLQKQSARLSGVLNGLDYVSWDPTTDPNVSAVFGSASLAQRVANKTALIDKLGLIDRPDTLLAAIISRLTVQKGIDIGLASLEDWCARGHQVVVVGSGDPWLEDAARGFAARHAGNVSVQIGYHAQLASLVYAGADIFLMPSRYEPCGISQMIAMRYGCLPVARAVGGLKDTVRDVAQGRGTGFLFEEESQHALAGALWRAEALYQEPARWKAAQARGMKVNFSWNKSGKEYIALYEEMKTA